MASYYDLVIIYSSSVTVALNYYLSRAFYSSNFSLVDFSASCSLTHSSFYSYDSLIKASSFNLSYSSRVRS